MTPASHMMTQAPADPVVTTTADAAVDPTAAVRQLGDVTLPLARRTRGWTGSVIDASVSLLASRTNDIVRFGMGAPAEQVVPAADFAEILGTMTDPSSYTYGPTEGETELINAICASEDLTGPRTVDPNRIIVTSGGMQGLDLAYKMFVNDGDLVAVESPTYTNGSSTALSYGAEVLQIPVDDDGMDVERLARDVATLGRTPTAIYVIPNFQNPSGVTMSLARRQRLLELAHEWNSVIIDDDPYGSLRFSGEYIPSFAELSPDDPLVFSARSFSKIIAPGLRVGWVEVDPALRQLLINVRQAMDASAAVPSQQLVAHYLTRGGFTEHLDMLRTAYHRRKDAMLEAAAEHLAGRVELTNPDGGFFLWATLVGDAADIDAHDLFETALDEGVAFIPGEAFSPAGEFSNAMRLCFASSTVERIHEGIARLGRAIEVQLSRS
ncbi:PLP-dependent aminotransferase family protein [Brevibacterium luteolum]|uniref:aminotransferase-like domain-containing protein n=1 Tax=Brevibacterium luteolum TaxID=199591 RepID=UPI0020B24266|nr:PLP-dependent aminotransferase family protein [Brevibacterium luteolum]